MNVMQLNTDIYNSLGVLSNDESYLEKAARYLKKLASARVISFMAIMNEEDGFIELLTIYDKSEMESISDKELLNLMKRNGLF